MTKHYSSINDFNNKNKDKDKIEVLNSMNRIELLDFLLTFLKLTNQEGSTKEEYTNLLKQNDLKKETLLSELNQNYSERKNELYNNFIQNKIAPILKKINSPIEISKLLLLLGMVLISTIITLYLTLGACDFFINRTYTVKYGVPIIATLTFAIISVTFSPWFKSVLNIDKDLLKFIAMSILVSVFIIVNFIYGKRALVERGFWTNIIFTSIFCGIGALIIGYLVRLLAAPFKIFNKDYSSLLEITKQKANEDFNKHFSDETLKNEIGIYEQQNLIIKEHKNVESRLHHLYNNHKKDVNVEYTIMNKYVPVAFQDSSHILLLIDALQNGYAKNWQEAIKWAHEEIKHQETQYNLNQISNSIVNIGNKIINYQENIVKQNEVQLHLLDSIDDSIKQNTQEIIEMQYTIDQNFQTLQSQNNRIISKLNNIELTQIFSLLSKK